MIGNKLRQVLIKLILGTVPPVKTGIVKSVDEGDFTCVITPTDGGPNYENVRLNVSINDDDNGLVTIPDVNSLVIISPLFNNEHAYYVSRFSKVKKWILKDVSGRLIEFDGEGKIKINGDDFGGLVMIQPLVDKLNNLEDIVNDLISKYNLHTHPVPGVTVGASSTTSSVTATTETNTLIPTQVSDLENENVLHG